MDVEIEQRIAATPERVFAVFTDFRQADQRLSGIDRLEVLTDGPIREGAEFRETRTLFGQTRTETLRLTAFEPPRRYTVTGESCGVRFDTTFTFEPTDDGQATLVNMHLHSTSLTILATLMTPLSALTAGSLKSMMQRDLDELRAVCEQSAQA
ncbi:MAG: hypothetical protein GVY24_02245 [Planctomycetes bacterium]|nr:hypothetical protein [Planctomycetota bacterium]